MREIRRILIAILVVCACLSAHGETNKMEFIQSLATRISPGMGTNQLDGLFGSPGRVWVMGRATAYLSYPVGGEFNVLVYCNVNSNGFVVSKAGVLVLPAEGYHCNGKPILTRLSEAEALTIADRVAIQKQGKSQDFDLKFYPERTAQINEEGKMWSIHYWRIPNRWPGDHFTVEVKDDNGQAEYSAGL